ncbi:MAG: efflux RND transporter periplasmic adaptor subunit [Nitrospiraceae bacterium]|nr:efflux RND transporter periplasmic adaptor subunit [Nitrospiraceae bacterium]
MKNTKASPPALAALAAAACLLFAACAPKPGPAAPRPAVPVSAAYAVTRSVPVRIRAIGQVEAYNSVQIKSMVNGQIVAIHYRDGQFVRKGQLLFEIDRRPYEAALEQARANLARDIVLAENAKKDAARYAILVKKQYVPREQYDQKEADAAAAEAVVRADRAAIENIEVEIDYCMIRSPIDGRTGSTQIQIGNVVKANDVPMLVIEQINPVYVSFSVPERYLPEIKKYSAKGPLRAEARVPGQKMPETGKLSFINNQVDASTGTILLKATFRNRDRVLWPGQFANVTLTLRTMTGAVLVPSQAIQTGPDGQYVYTIKPDMTAALRPVTPDGTYGGFTIVKKGIASGERVVTDGQLRLVPGGRVSVKPPVGRG